MKSTRTRYVFAFFTHALCHLALPHTIVGVNRVELTLQKQHVIILESISQASLFSYSHDPEFLSRQRYANTSWTQWLVCMAGPKVY